MNNTFSSSDFFRLSDPAVSYQSALLEQSGLDEVDLPSTSSIGFESPYFTGRNINHDNLIRSTQMIGQLKFLEYFLQFARVLMIRFPFAEIAEAPETTATHKIKEFRHETSNASEARR